VGRAAVGIDLIDAIECRGLEVADLLQGGGVARLQRLNGGRRLRLRLVGESIGLQQDLVTRRAGVGNGLARACSIRVEIALFWASMAAASTALPVSACAPRRSGSCVDANAIAASSRSAAAEKKRSTRVPASLLRIASALLASAGVKRALARSAPVPSAAPASAVSDAV